MYGSRGVTRPASLRALKEKDVKIKKRSTSKLRVYVPADKKGSLYFAMQVLKTALPSVIVQGIPTVNRAVINEIDKDGEQSYNLLVEGYGLQDVMGSPGIDGRHTWTNHVLEVEQVLGVEAARTQISSEISYIMNAYGIGIDTRHMLLLSDVMTFKGEVLGITRFGVSKMRESVLMLASFEKTTDHLFDAAVHGRSDEVVGVSECIIMGIPIPIGTGLPTILWKSQQ
jgi:DNA-directed RNA polymerase III subunit RPC1